METLEEAEKEHAEKETEAPNVACIFGSNYAEKCAVRVELQKRKKREDGLSKYLQSTNPAFNEVKVLFGFLGNMLSQISEREYSDLCGFCRACPIIKEKVHDYENP